MTDPPDSVRLKDCDCLIECDRKTLYPQDDPHCRLDARERKQTDSADWGPWEHDAAYAFLRRKKAADGGRTAEYLSLIYLNGLEQRAQAAEALVAALERIRARTARILSGEISTGVIGAIDYDDQVARSALYAYGADLARRGERPEAALRPEEA